MNFQRSGVILVLIIIISSSTSTAQTTSECKERIPCFNPDLSLGVGDIFHWDVKGQNISEQVDAFEWEDLRLTHIELEITEDIRGLSTSVARNFAKYFKLIYTLDGNDIDYSDLLTGVYLGNSGIVFNLLSYTHIMDQIGELSNVFVNDVQIEGRNFTYSRDRSNKTYHTSLSSNKEIQNGVYKKVSRDYQHVTPEGRFDEILSSTEVFEEERFEVETGVLLLHNTTKIIFDQTSGSKMSQKIFVLEQYGNQAVEFSLGEFDRGVTIIVIGLSIGVMATIFILLKKYA